MSDPTLTTCPECKQEKFTKMLSAAGFQLKGNGYYATDFKGGSAKPKEEKAESSAHSCGTGACGACSS